MEAKEFNPVYFAELFVIMSSRRQMDSEDLIIIRKMAINKIDNGCMYKISEPEDNIIRKIPITEKTDIDTIRKYIINILDFDYEKIAYKEKELGIECNEYEVDFDREITYVRSSYISFSLYYLNCMQKLQNFRGEELTDKMFENMLHNPKGKLQPSDESLFNCRSTIALYLMHP